MSEQFHTGKGAFLKNLLAGKPPKVDRMARHYHALEEPEPIHQAGPQVPEMDCLSPKEVLRMYASPEFDFAY